jgi:hypothetical protein
MLLNIEIAVKIGTRLIERLPPLDSPRRWSEKAQAAIDPQTPAMPGARKNREIRTNFSGLKNKKE